MEATEMWGRDDAAIVAGVELGGTKAHALVARGSTILERVRIGTQEPSTTLGALSEQLVAWRQAGHAFQALGIASFGPVGLDPARPDFGHVTTTPKPGWTDADVRGHFAQRFDVPIAFDTDVNGAALAEWRWGAAQRCDVAVYLTIGTGIGGGVVVNGRPVHGLLHPEHGHLRVRRRVGDVFTGICPFHGDCIEGLCSGPAIAARAGAPAENLPEDHPVWADVADEVAELLALLVLTLSPQRIILGGGVGHGQRWILPRVRTTTLASLGGYLAGIDGAALDQMIVSPAFGDDAGPLGTVALALTALASGSWRSVW